MVRSFSRDEAIYLASGEYGHVTLQTVAHFAAPLFLVSEAADGKLNLKNGTTFFVDAGEGCFAVTACHVLRKFQEIKACGRRVRCQIAPHTYGPPGRNMVDIDPDDALIAADDELDIATFHVSPEQLSDIGSPVLQSWPPIPPQEGFGVAFAGFPGRERRVVSLREIEFAVFPALSVATTVNERRISCQVQWEYVVETPGFAPMPHNYETGGISGGPLLTHVESASGLTHWRLGGVMSEGSADLEIMYAARVDALQRDGTLVTR